MPVIDSLEYGLIIIMNIHASEPIITFDTVCRKLVLEGGWITYSNNQGLNSVATYQCNERLELTNSSQRTCMIDGQWSGTGSICG